MLTDWRSFLVLDREIKKGRKVVVLDVECEDETVERVAVAEGTAGQVTSCVLAMLQEICMLTVDADESY